MVLRRTAAALLAPLVLLAGGEAEAQSSPETERTNAPALQLDGVPASRSGADLAVRGITEQDFDRSGDGLVRSWELEGDAVLGIGRFTVPELPRRRTWMEDNETPTGVRPEEGGIAAIGIKVPF